MNERLLIIKVMKPHLISFVFTEDKLRVVMMRHHKRPLSAMKQYTSHAFRVSFSTNSCCKGNVMTLDGHTHNFDPLSTQYTEV